MAAFQTPEPTPEPTTSPDDPNFPYFPEYFGGTVTSLSKDIDTDRHGNLTLEWIGADREAIEKVRELRDSLASAKERLVSVCANERLSKKSQREYCGFQLTAISYTPDMLRFVARYGKHAPLSKVRDFLSSSTE